MDPLVEARLEAQLAAQATVDAALKDALAADETPAQPDEELDAAERADRDALIAMQNWDAAEDDARPAAVAGLATGLTPAHPFTSENVEPGGQKTRSEPAIGPAAVAGRAGEDDGLYLLAATAMIPFMGPGDGALFDWAEWSTAAIPHPSAAVRAAVDAARAPLLAELADLAETLRVCEGQRDRRDAELVEVVDGGEWQWGVRWTGLDGQPIDWLQGVTETGAREFVAESDNGATLVRRLIGPVEPVTDDGSGT